MQTKTTMAKKPDKSPDNIILLFKQIFSNEIKVTLLVDITAGNYLWISVVSANNIQAYIVERKTKRSGRSKFIFNHD